MIRVRKQDKVNYQVKTGGGGMDKIKAYYSLKIGEKTKEEGEIECLLFRSLEEVRKHMDELMSEEK